jgi:hypothetical protein
MGQLPPPPHPLHTHSRSTSYIYKVFQHLLLWLVVVWMQSQLILPLGDDGRGKRKNWQLKILLVLVLDMSSLCNIIFETPAHPYYTHIRSTSYIYNVFRTLYCGQFASSASAPLTIIILLILLILDTYEQAYQIFLIYNSGQWTWI